MRKLGIIGAALLLLGLAAGRASADLVEVRLGGGMSFVDSDDFDKKVGSSESSLKIEDVTNWNADVFFNIPVLPIGAGLRYEISQQDQKATAVTGFQEWDMEAGRFSILVDWRFIDTIAYIGPIASFGVHNGDIEVKKDGNKRSISLDQDGPNISLGLEAGIRIRGFIIGGEVGYQRYKFKDPKDANLDAPVDLSGGYGKILIGYAFL